MSSLHHLNLAHAPIACSLHGTRTHPPPGAACGTSHLRVRALLDLLEASRLRDRNPGLMAAAEGVLKYGGAERCAL